MAADRGGFFFVAQAVELIAGHRLDVCPLPIPPPSSNFWRALKGRAL